MCFSKIIISPFFSFISNLTSSTGQSILQLTERAVGHISLPSSEIGQITSAIKNPKGYKRNNISLKLDPTSFIVSFTKG